METEKTKKTIKTAGTFLVVYGWTYLIWMHLFYLWVIFQWSILDAGASFSPFLNWYFSDIIFQSSICVLFIIFGNRINALNEKNLKIYLWISFLLAILLFVIQIIKHVLFFPLIISGILIIYLTSAIVAINKLMQNQTFTPTLTASKYFSKKERWIIFGAIIGSFITLLLGSSFLMMITAQSRQNLSAIQSALEKSDSSHAKQAKGILWISLSSYDDKFKVNFPLITESKTVYLQTPNSKIKLKTDIDISVLSNGTVFSLLRITYPHEMNLSGKEDLELKNWVSEWIKINQGFKLISSKLRIFNGIHSLDFILKKKHTYSKGRMLIFGQRFFLLIVTYEENNYNEAEYNRFINSFELQ